MCADVVTASEAVWLHVIGHRDSGQEWLQSSYTSVTLHEVFTTGSQAKKTSSHLLAVKLELGLEFQCCRTISVHNPHSQSWAVFAQVGLGKVQMESSWLQMGTCIWLASVRTSSWVKNPFYSLKPGHDADVCCVPPQAKIEAITLFLNLIKIVCCRHVLVCTKYSVL